MNRFAASLPDSLCITMRSSTSLARFPQKEQREAYVVGQLGALIPLPGEVGGTDGGLIAALVLYARRSLQEIEAERLGSWPSSRGVANRTFGHRQAPWSDRADSGKLAPWPSSSPR